jgi:hypothetical protein
MIGAVAGLGSCSSQDPAFTEDVTSKQLPDQSLDQSNDAVAAPGSEDDQRTNTVGSQSTDDGGETLEQGADGSVGQDASDPVVFIAGKDDIPKDLLDAEIAGQSNPTTTTGGGDGSGGTDGSNNTDGNEGGGNGDGGNDGSGGGNGGEPGLQTFKLAKTFAAAEVLSGEKIIQIDQPTIDSYTLARAYNEQTQTFTQITRNNLMDSFTQGTSGNANVDNFTQLSQSGVLDVLIVIDTSGSMNQEQNNLSTKLEPLLSYVQEADWRVGVVTTDYNQGCMRDIINKSDADKEQKFANAIQAGTNGSGNEQGIRMAVEGLKGECLSQPWLRENSTIAVLIVSDEDNCSNGTGCGSAAWSTSDYLYNHLDSIRTPGNDARVYGLFWHPTVSSASCNTAAYRANIYADIVSSTNGTWGTICDANYTQTLEAISQNIGTILKNQFALSQTPEPNSVSVTIDGMNQANGWSIAGNVITFTSAPTEGAIIAVSYQYGATPIYDTFALNQPAAPGTVTAKINNNSTSAFTYSAQANTVTFDSPPPEAAQVTIHFKENVDLVNNFAIDNDAISGSVSVKVNASPIDAQDFTYDENNHSLTLDEPAPEGASIEVGYLKPGAPILSYPYAMAEDQTAISVSRADSGQVIPATYDDSMQTFTIANADFVDGLQIDVGDPDHAIPEFVELWYDTGATLVADSAILQIGTEQCNSLQYSQSSIGVEACDLSGLDDDSGSLTYSYYGPIQLSYELNAAFFEQPHSYQIWRVEKNGEEFTDFTIEGNGIVITGALEVDAEIKIKVTLLGSN